MQVKLAATAANGDKIVQTLTFHRGSYVIDVAFDVTNAELITGYVTERGIVHPPFGD